MVCLGDGPNTQAKLSDLQIIVTQKTFQNKPSFAPWHGMKGSFQFQLRHIEQSTKEVKEFYFSKKLCREIFIASLRGRLNSLTIVN